MNVILQGDGSPFGVLEVDSTSEGEFSEHDIAFLQGAANILGMAIEHQAYQRKLQASLDRYEVLLRELITASRTACRSSRACSSSKRMQ
jgi:GAF domain-containing protein